MTVPLPPLPRVGGETTGRSVIDVVEEQHRGLLTLCVRSASPRCAIEKMETRGRPSAV